MTQPGSMLAAAVADLVLGEGECTARIADGRAPHRVTLRVAGFAPESWQRIVAALAADPALTAAMLDGELPASLMDALGDAEALPPVTELRGRCGCGAWPELCDHGLAVWRAVESEVGRRPALALRLRGRDPEQLAAQATALAEVAVDDHDPGVDAGAAYMRSAAQVPVIPVPAAAEVGRWQPPSIPGGRMLLDAAADAAARALALLRGDGDGRLDLDVRGDLARIGAGVRVDWDLDHLAWRAGMRPADLRALVSAWKVHHGEAEDRVVAPEPAADDDPRPRVTGSPGQLDLF